MLSAHALETLGLRLVFESNGMQFPPATFLKANEDLSIETRFFICVFVVTTGFELTLVDSSPGPAEVLANKRLELDGMNRLINDLVSEALMNVTAAFFKPDVVVVIAGRPLALPAPFALVPFILPAVTWFPVLLNLKVKDIESAMGGLDDSTKVFVGFDCGFNAIDRLSHDRFVETLKGPPPTRASLIHILLLISRSKRAEEDDDYYNQKTQPHIISFLCYD